MTQKKVETGWACWRCVAELYDTPCEAQVMFQGGALCAGCLRFVLNQTQHNSTVCDIFSEVTVADDPPPPQDATGS